MKNCAKRNLPPKKIILNITPRTHVRTTVGDRWVFRIPRNKLRPAGLKRLLRIEQYNNYKIELLAEAKRKNFKVPSHGFSITFYIPVPKSWSNKKKKLHHGTLHQSTPDLDNFLKAAWDSMLSEDKYIAQYTACKRWVDFDAGWIEIELSDTPCQITITPPAKE